MISVIIPVYNVEQYLRKCIDSILAQTYTNHEIILVDDGSPDRSGAICDEYAQRDERIKVIHKENGGVSSARMAGLNIAKGEWIAFIDADDLIDGRYLETLMADAYKYNADIVCCDCREIENSYDGDEINKFRAVKNDRLISEREAYFNDYVLLNELYGRVVWGKIIKRELALSESFDNIKHSEDYLYMMRLFAKNPVTYLDAYKGYSYIRWKDSATIRYGKMNIGRAVDYIYVMQQRLNIVKQFAAGSMVRRCLHDYVHSIYCCLSIMIIADEHDAYTAERLQLVRYINECLGYKKIGLKYRLMLGFYRLDGEMYWNTLKPTLDFKKKFAKE